MRRRLRLLHEVDELAHDRVELEVLRSEHAGDARRAQPLGVGVRDDAADDDRDATDPGGAHSLEHVGNEREVRAAEDAQPDEVNTLLERGGRELLRRDADAFVDDVEPGVTRLEGDSARRRSSVRRARAFRRGAEAGVRAPSRARRRAREGGRPPRHDPSP